MTAAEFAAIVIATVQVYLLLGVVFAVVFVIFLAPRVDPGAADSSWGFRIMVIPGLTLLWPLMLHRVLRTQAPPVECNAHRRNATTQTAARPKSR